MDMSILFRQQLQNEIRAIDNQLNQMHMQRQGMGDYGMHQQGIVFFLTLRPAPTN